MSAREQLTAGLTVTISAPLGPMLCEMAARTGTPVEEWVEWMGWVKTQERLAKR